MKKTVVALLFGLLLGLSTPKLYAQTDSSATSEEPRDTISVEESVPVYYEENTEKPSSNNNSNYLVIGGVILLGAAAIILLRKKKK